MTTILSILQPARIRQRTDMADNCGQTAINTSFSNSDYANQFQNDIGVSLNEAVEWCHHG